MQQLLELIAKGLVDHPDSVEVRLLDGDDDETLVYELSVTPEDLGKVIGKQGRTARAIRTILASAGAKLRKRIVFEIVE